MLVTAYRNVCKHPNTHRALLKCFTVSACARSLSSRPLDPTVLQFVSRLVQKQPSFPIPSKDVHVLSQPSEFYQNLLVSTPIYFSRAMITMYIVAHHPSRTPADFSIVIIHWFLGERVGGYIMRLVAQDFGDSYQVDALDDALHRNPGLHLYLNLDYNRSTRPGLTSPILALLPLLRNYEHRVHISLFRSPKLSGMTAKIVPPRFNEGWGTWHAKIYGSDDDVMISGLVTLKIAKKHI